MNKKLIITIKKALLRMHKRLTGQETVVSRDFSKITLNGKRQKFDERAMEVLRLEIVEQCRDNIQAVGKISQ